MIDIRAKEQVGPTKGVMCKERKQINGYCPCCEYIDVIII
jgi:hypothetical protein